MTKRLLRCFLFILNILGPPVLGSCLIEVSLYYLLGLTLGRSLICMFIVSAGIWITLIFSSVIEKHFF